MHIPRVLYRTPAVRVEGRLPGGQRHAEDDAEEDRDDQPEEHEDVVVNLAPQGRVRAQHEVEVAVEVDRPIDPHDEDHLKNGDPHDRHAAAVVVHDLEDVGAGVGDAGQAEQEAGRTERNHHHRLVLQAP